MLPYFVCSTEEIAEPEDLAEENTAGELFA